MDCSGHSPPPHCARSRAAQYYRARFEGSVLGNHQILPTDDIRDRMARVGGGPDGIAEGVKIAKEMLDQFKDEVIGCYIMPQLGKYEAAVTVLDHLGYCQPDSAARRDATN